MYTKTNWVDNTTPIDKTNLNKIEQGIYDNSIVVDAVTNTLNPTDTETYKTVELTEGQITDVIGVNDIVINGQTSQDGTPTPSAPVNINVVSGSNVVNTSNKNLFDGILENSGFQATGLNAGGNTKRIRSKNYTRVKENQTYTINITEYNTTKGTISITISYYNKNDYSTARLSESGWKNLPYTFITPENCKFIRFLCKITSSSGESEIIYTDVNKAQLEQSSTATTYEPHQGKELPLDLPVENLFDKNNITDGQFINADGTLSASVNYVTTDFIPITPNAKYYLPKTSTRRLKYFNSNKQVLSSSDWDIASSISGQVLTTPANAYYVRFSIDKSQNNINTFQFEQGSKANAYTPYGTEPIELCKIGNYQDYFYKSGSKWYLHKGVNKITSYNGETITTSYISTTGELSTGAKVYYALATATNTEITNTTLISQLEAIYNAPLYEETNITQTNNDLAMILDITACKDNINGIKAFIRK